MRGKRSLCELASLVLPGCESELELWGYTGVFDVPGLRDATRQRVVRVGGKTYRLDVAYDEEMLDVELDGRRFHASPSGGSATSPEIWQLPLSAGRRSGFRTIGSSVT